MNLYEDLGIASDSDEAAIKRAHRKAVKKLHPDNTESGDRAKFEVVQRAFMVLSDPARRSRYDETGTVDDNPGNELAILTEIIMAAFDQVMNQVGDRFASVDIIRETKGKIKDRQRDNEIAKANVAKQVSQIERVLNRVRFKKNDGFNPIHATLTQRIEAGRNAQQMAEREAIGIVAALAYLEFYGFDFDAPPPPATYRFVPMNTLS